MKTSAVENPDEFIFVPSLKKFSLFSGELLLRELSIQSINKFLENSDRNSLDTRSFSAIFHKVPKADSCAHKVELQIKATYKRNFPFIKVIFLRNRKLQYSLFPFCVSESNSLENFMCKARSMKHFKSMVMQFFTLFSCYFQNMTK